MLIAGISLSSIRCCPLEPSKSHLKRSEIILQKLFFTEYQKVITQSAIAYQLRYEHRLGIHTTSEETIYNYLLGIIKFVTNDG